MEHRDDAHGRRAIRKQSLHFAVTAARAASISRAASLLNVSQPTVSQAIADLEVRCGTPLFHRDGRGIRPTAAGHRVLSLAEGLLSDLDRLEQDMATLANTRPAAVSIGMPPSVAGVLASPLVGQITADMPGVELRVVESYSGAVQRSLLSGDLDIGIVYANQSVSGMPSDRVVSERLLAVGAAGDPELEAEAIPLSRVARLPLVMPSRGHGLRQLVERQARRNGCSLNIAIEVDAMGAAKELCEAGGLYTILPACAVEREVDLARLATRPVVEPDLVRDLSIVTTTARPLSPAARAVARQAIETARALVATRRWHATV